MEKEFAVSLNPTKVWWQSPNSGAYYIIKEWDEWLKKYGFPPAHMWGSQSGEYSSKGKSTLGDDYGINTVQLPPDHCRIYFERTLYRIDDFLAEMSFEHLAGQVILPVSSEFFYKNIRYHEGATPEDNLISLDISYKTES